MSSKKRRSSCPSASTEKSGKSQRKRGSKIFHQNWADALFPSDKIKEIIYRLTHSAGELSGFTCTSSPTMNEKFQYRTTPPSAVLKISSSLLVNECR